MIISKEAFIDIINRLIKTNEFANEINAKARKLDNVIESDFLMQAVYQYHLKLMWYIY